MKDAAIFARLVDDPSRAVDAIASLATAIAVWCRPTIPRGELSAIPMR
jgi:hypothetical protein